MMCSRGERLRICVCVCVCAREREREREEATAAPPSRRKPLRSWQGGGGIGRDGWEKCWTYSASWRGRAFARNAFLFSNFRVLRVSTNTFRSQTISKDHFVDKFGSNRFFCSSVEFFNIQFSVRRMNFLLFQYSNDYCK